MDNARTKPKLKRKSFTDRFTVPVTRCGGWRLLTIGSLKKRCQPFLGSYTTKWQCIKQSQTKNVPGYAFCTVCGCDFSVAHGGKDDVRRHIDSAKHIKITRLQHKVNQFQIFFNTQDVNNAFRK